MQEKSRNKKTGKLLIIFGVLTLIAGILVMFAVGTFAVPVLVFLSVLLNSLGIMLVRKK